MKFKHEMAMIKLFGHSSIVEKVQQVVHDALFIEKERVVAFGLAHFPGLFCLGFISFHFFF